MRTYWLLGRHGKGLFCRKVANELNKERVKHFDEKISYMQGEEQEL